jgi:NAD(P)-dependent dehydrogenase (short-subunit alcohol dehydrogenase family)
MMQDTPSKVALVTGAARGIGRCIAQTFAREGARVMICDVLDDGGATTVREIREAGGEAACRLCDVAQLDQVEALVAATVETYGRLDILVNNAAVWRGGTVTEMPPADWELGRGSILDAAYYCCKAAIPRLVEAGGGSIISISSVHGFLAARRSAAYEAAKGGLILLMKEVACDYGPRGIRANCICPGLIVTEKNRPRFEENAARARLEAEVYPLRRYGAPQDIANAALFLASDESSFITGHALMVDGGLTSQLQDDVAYRIAAYVREQEGAGQ